MPNLQDNAKLHPIGKPKIVFSDFDGTLTDHTRFSPIFFDILHLLDQHHIPLVIVTGRSLSWGHFLLTHFDAINHVIAEGGGIVTYKDKHNTIHQSPLITDETIEQLEGITNRLRRTFPALRLSADSLGRVTDRAIELEDLNKDKSLFQAVREFLVSEGANSSTSTVHLNFWCGQINKFTAMEGFVRKHYPHLRLEESVFFGDSLNDESVFQHLPNSIAVANISTILHELNHKPQYILTDTENSGPAGVHFALQKLLHSA